jgi:alanyl-tRNA synthetase
VQKCLRAGGKQSDLENVGRTVRHHTFFEMLGNFSFGDYFKKEAIETAWELSVDVWGFDAGRIWISIFEDDDEAHDLWAKHIGIPKERIVRLGRKDNFWGPVGDTGVCGPSSELHYDTGDERGCHRDTCKPGCECDRYIEFWNLVFPQFFLTEDGDYDPLPRPGIDTGMGLERVAFILQQVKDNFHTDLFLPIRLVVKKAFPKKQTGEKAEVAVNVACDHVRALVFALAEGVMPSNEGRGYVLRRLLRRALTKMHPCGVRQPFLAAAVDAVIDTVGDRYPELGQRAELIKKVITAEEEHFLSTIDQGWNKVQEVIEQSKKRKSRDRAGASFSVDLGGGAETEFLGYDELACDANLALVESYGEDDRQVIEATTNRTVFYPEGGGQVGDTGTAQVGDQRLNVTGAFRRDNQIVHRMRWAEDPPPAEDVASFFRSNPNAHLVVDKDTRLSTARNHTATHLLHAALREVLGDHVAQAGSLVAPDRLRFDFHHFQPMTAQEVSRVERMVNDAVLSDLVVRIDWLPREKAFAEGAIALFGEKYGDTVRVVSIDRFSKELCAGTHLRHTGEIGLFIIRQETAVAAGVRRIEALTGWGAHAYFRDLFDGRSAMARELKVAPEDLGRRIRALAEENETLKRKLLDSENEQAVSSVGDAVEAAEDVGGIKLATFKTGSGDLASLRRAGDTLRGRLDLGLGLLCLEAGRKAIVLIVVSDRLVESRAVKANEIAGRVGEKFSLRGGGKQHMAQLGIRDKSDFEKIVSYVRSLLKGVD